MKEKRIKPPAYIFKKLNRYFAVSTYSGDFYEVSEETYLALNKWNEEIINLDKEPASDAVVKSAKTRGIPLNIIESFLSSEKSRSSNEEGDIPTNITDLTLNLTSKCNLRCLYCWNDQGRYSDASFQKGRYDAVQKPDIEKDMTVEVARKSVDILVNLCNSDRNLVVDFYGGEPLMNLETLLATVDYCRRNEAKWNASFHFLLATNGTLLTPSLAEELIDKGIQIAVSIDGPKSVQDNNRPFVNGDGSFDKIASNLKNMPDKIIKRLVGRTTVTPFYTDMVKLYKNLRDLGFERIELFESEDACHRVTPARESVFFGTAQQYRILREEYERLAQFYIDETIGGFLDYRKTFFNRFFKLMQRLYYNHEISGGCPAAKGQIAVSSEGDIYPCTSFLGVERFNLGNVQDGLDTEKYNRFIKDIERRLDNCSDCPLFSLCRSTGSCLNMNYYFCGDPALPYQVSCELFREKLELAIACLAVLSEKIPHRLEEVFGFDPVGKRGNELY
ncbi:MAG: radical SAM protein [Candidatus Omnitrophota bacterium]